MGRFSPFSPYFYADRERLFLWSPVLMGAGITTFVSLPHEPPAWIGPGITLGMLVLAIFTFKMPRIRLIMIAFFLPALGFSLIQVKAHRLQTPMVRQEQANVTLTGVVLSVEKTFRKARILMAIQTSDPLIPLAHVRYYAKDTKKAPLPPLIPGTDIRVKVNLAPVSPPLVARGFDFRRKAFFENLSAYAFPTETSLEIIGKPQNLTLNQYLQTLRSLVTNRIRETLPKSKEPLHLLC